MNELSLKNFISNEKERFMKSNSLLSENEINILVEKSLENQLQLEQLATENCLLRVVAGSNSYGTNLPTSDWDERGLFTDNIERVTLPFDKIEQITFISDDIVYYELSKYMPLLLAQNPNMIELLWTDPNDIIYKSALGQLLLDHRADFLSNKVKDSYIGYAKGQLKRIKGHNKWLNNPQSEKEPQLKDYCSILWNFSSEKNFNKTVPFEGYCAVSLGDNNYSLWEQKKLGLEEKSWIDKKGNPNPILKNELEKINVNNLSPSLIIKVNEKKFTENHDNWKSYWSWKKNRNDKRSQLEELYGYDTKHAMHLIRLLRSGIDILEKEIVPVKRDDANYLLDIRNGKYTYEEIVLESEKLSKKIEEVSLKSKLPSEPKYSLAKEIMLTIYKKQWSMDEKLINPIILPKNK